jgi:hypothetical protein
MKRYYITSLRRAYPKISQLLPGSIFWVGTNDGVGSYQFTVSFVHLPRAGRGGNKLMVGGMVDNFVGFHDVVSRLWLRQDGRWFLGIDCYHLRQLEYIELAQAEIKDGVTIH